MGGKNSKVKSGKKGKSKSKNGELDGLSAPEGSYEDGKYEDQATLPRPDLNLDGNSVNVGDNGKLEIMTEADTSIPNAEVDLETGDYSAVSDNLKNTAQAAANNTRDTVNQVSMEVSKNAGELEEKSQNALQEAKRVSGEVEKSAQAASDHVVEASGNVSETVNQNVDDFRQMSSDSVEESGRISGDFQTSAKAASDRPVEVSASAASSFSQNMDGVKQDSSEALEATGKISGEFQKSVHTVAGDGAAASHEASSSFSHHVDAFGEQANAKFDAADTAVTEGQHSVQEMAHEISDESRNSVSSFITKHNVDEVSQSTNVDEVSQSAAIRVSEGEEVSSMGVEQNAAKFSENVDGVIEAGKAEIAHAQDFTSESAAAGMAAVNSVSVSGFWSSQNTPEQGLFH